jgi:hypothetical protein
MWLSFVVVISSVYILLLRQLYHNIPLTVIRTKIDIYFDNVDGSVVRIAREQLLRANQNSVTAYFMEVAPTSPGGRIHRNDITMNLFCENCEFHEHHEIIGSEEKGFEIIHDFGRNLVITHPLRVGRVADSRFG